MRAIVARDSPSAKRSCCIATAVLASLTGILSSMAPAIRAAGLDPVAAIRG
jgi:ABC-type lipoprotein release transport system permease subunit